MKKLIIVLFLCFNAFGQNDSTIDSIQKTNPILFAEMVLGYSNGNIKGMTGMGSLNYQFKNNLFTFRGLEISNTKEVGRFLYFPIVILEEQLNEYSLLYGKRIINKNSSMSYSVGIAYLTREFLLDDLNTVTNYDNLNYGKDSFVGLPFEFNLKWFNSKKEKYRIYELIPVGKPIGFANSIGFKFYGTVSKTTFIGLGVTLGLGWHKKY